jgi:hypothetical protein
VEGNFLKIVAYKVAIRKFLNIVAAHIIPQYSYLKNFVRGIVPLTSFHNTWNEKCIPGTHHWNLNLYLEFFPLRQLCMYIKLL